jgi:formylglycine-generating enzyme required for sulfatase activity
MVCFGAALRSFSAKVLYVYRRMNNIGLELYEIIPHFPPVWAEVFGEDDCGIFAECSVQEARFVWRWICPGKFQMGSPDAELGDEDEKSQHEVILTRGFWLGESPVTQVQWQVVMEDNPSHFKGENRPVEKVSWLDCREYVRKLNDLIPELHVALPTEAQWEHACRAGTQSAFHDGSSCTEPEGDDPALRKLGWFTKNSEGETHDVKQKAPNAWGLYDMHGNVWEWCRDAWLEGAYADRRGTIFDPEISSQDESVHRVMRGGSWRSPARNCRAAIRDWFPSGDTWLARGFRLAAGQEPRKPQSTGTQGG